MSSQEFNKLYESIRNLPQDAASYAKPSYTKNCLTENLISALKCLEVANQLIVKQNDSIMAISNELTEQCRITREATLQVKQIESSATSNTTENKIRSFSDILKGPCPIIVKPTEGASQVNREELKQKAETALKGVKVSNARISNGGSLVVEVPSPSDHSTATDNLKAAFPANNFTVEAPKKIQPKLTITNVPNEYT